jgi:hypothetical protein
MSFPVGGITLEGDFDLQLDTIAITGEFFFYSGTNYPINSASLQPNDGMEFDYRIHEVQVFLGEVVNEWYTVSDIDATKIVEKYKGVFEANLLQAIEDGTL